MLAAAFVHYGSHLGPLAGIDAGHIAPPNTAILCDSIFLALSCYFAIRPPKTSLARYFARKVSIIILPLVVYSIGLCLYMTGLSGAATHGYIAYFSDVLTPRWFIPTLNPFLLIAPLLYWLFEKLSDRQAKTVATAACVLTAWGFISYVLAWALRSSGHETLVLVAGIFQRLVPTVMIPGSGYFAYCCLDYFFRRFAPSTLGATRKKLIVIGLCAWVIDVACAYFGVDRFDPSFPWLFATIAVLFLFDRIRITNVGAQRAFEWTGRRSHSIYLLQYTAITIVAPFAYDTLLVGGIGGFIAPIPLLVWVGVVAESYALSLAVASLVDVTLLKLVQVGYDGIAKRVVRWFEAVER